MSNPAISVILVSEKGAETLAVTLGCLAAQCLPQGVDFEVVLVHSRERREADPGTWPYPIRLVHQPELLFGYSWRAAACNRGVEVAAGELIVFLAEGLVVEKSFLADHWQCHATGQRICVLGQLLGPDRDSGRGWLREIAPWALVNGVNLSVRQREMKRIGGYDVAYAAYEVADAELGYRLWKAGVKIVFTPNADAHWGGSGQGHGSWRGRGLDYLAYKHPETRSVVRLWQIETDIEGRTGLLHSHAYQERMKALLLTQPPSGVDGAFDWSLVCFLTDHVNSLDGIERWANRDQQAGPVEILLIDSRSSPPPGAVMAATQTIDLPLTYRPFASSLELGEMAYLRLAQRLAAPKIKTPATRDLWGSLHKDLSRREHALRQAGLNWVRVTARSSLALLETGQNDLRLPHRRRRVSEKPVRDSNCLAKIRQSALWATRGSKVWGPLEDGYSYPPRAISFKLTHLCNLRCEMCGQWGAVGNAFRQDGKTLREQMSFSELQTIVDEITAWRPGMIYVWGGEPFLHPDFIAFIDYIRRKGLYGLVTTNGLRLVETADDLVACGLHTLRVSLDGPPEVHDRIRGRPGTFTKAIEGIQMVKAIRARREVSWPSIEVFCTISPGNYRFLEALVDELESLGVDALNFGHMMHVPPALGERHQCLFQELFDIKAEAWRGFAQDVTCIDVDRLMATIERLQNRSTSFPIGFEPPLRSLGEIPIYYRDPSLLFSGKHCRGPWLWAEIHPNGDLSFCDEYPDYIVGNVLRDGFAETWNNPRARDFRRQVLAHKRFPICTPCHLLHLGPP